jgi:hypothetical protein
MSRDDHNRCLVGLFYIEVDRFDDAFRLININYNQQMARLGEDDPTTLLSLHILGG